MSATTVTPTTSATTVTPTTSVTTVTPTTSATTETPTTSATTVTPTTSATTVTPTTSATTVTPTISATTETPTTSATTVTPTTSATTLTPTTSTTTVTSTTPATTVTPTTSATTLTPTTSATTVTPTTSATTVTPTTSATTVTPTTSATTVTSTTSATTVTPTTSATTATPTTSATTEASTTTNTAATTTTNSPLDCGTIPFSYESDDTIPRSDDVCTGRITVITKVPFQGQTYRTIHICPNGLVCFGGKLQTYTIPQAGEFRYTFLGRACLAPYFSDLITYSKGNIHYRYIYPLDNTSATEIGEVKAIVAESQGVDIEPSFILIVTWDGVPHFSSANGDVTFQVVYVTDGSRSYSFYYYKDGAMTITVGNVFIGILVDGGAVGFANSPDGSFLRSPDKNLFSLNCDGRYEYIDPETDIVDPENICIKWHSKELVNRAIYQISLSVMPRCPCVRGFLFFDRRFIFDWSNWNTAGPIFSTAVRPSVIYSPFGKTCEYDTSTNTFIGGVGSNSSSFVTYNPFTHTQQYVSNDLYYKRACCEDSELCHLYFQVRPQHTCYTRFPFRFSWLFGDPHITTLDNNTYTFNGHDEYVLLNITTQNFKIQCRTDRALKTDGNVSLATVFTAFVVSGDDVWLQAELNATRNGLIVYAGENASSFQDYTDAFNTNSLSVIEEELSQKLSLERSGNILMTTFFGVGVSFNVTLGKKLLQLGIGLPETLENQTVGLLGNFNNNPDDDYMPRSSNQPLPSNSSERTIFQDFGQTWRTTAEESIFKYDDEKSHADYSTDFVPSFIEDADKALRQEAEETCGQGQAQCIFDYVFTGDAEIAQETLSTQTRADFVTEEAANEVPSISVQSGLEEVNGQRRYLYTNLSQESSFDLMGNDDGTFEYRILSNSASFVNIATLTNNSARVTVILDNTEPKIISLTVVDNLEVYAESIEVIIVLCTGCSSQGSCDFTVFREDDNRTTSTFKLAVCECLDYWEGDDCDQDYDGCQDDPCAAGRNCTNKPASVHQSEVEVDNNTNSRPYTCSPCPAGYIIDEDEKCEDMNECDSTDNGNCSQSCINTEGSYYCACNSTYRLATDHQTCNDVNECDEATSDCDQTCNNTNGGFECGCFDGYNYNTSTSTCDETNDLESQCGSINCTNADGCTLNSTSNAVCFCNAGYQLLDNNTCIDVDECSQSVCSQRCTNSIGSYTCSCLTGFQLNQDKITCNGCDFPFYGENCASTCACGRGNDGCDNVHGCLCKAGWTGTDCNTDINECGDLNICEDINNICTNTVGSFTCKCRNGYVLQNGTCTDEDECADADLNTCDQQCNNNVGGFICGCRDGFTVNVNDDTKCTDIDECSSGVSTCDQTCINTRGSYRCECFFGYLLNEDRRKCTLVQDPCTLFPDVNCSDVCRVIGQQAVCSCNVGYQLGVNNQTCIDIDECDADLDLNQCTQTDTCVNTKGGYECSCSVGFKLEQNLRTCTACDNFHWGDNCNNNCDCGVGSTRCDAQSGCVCEAGWSGVLCDKDKDECAGSPCGGDNQECVNSPGSYSCTCLDGYEDGTDGNCKNIDECSGINDCSQICTDSEGSYTCSCELGFLQQGTSCSDIDECSGQHGCSQNCFNTLGSYLCSCDDGFKLQLTDRKTCIPASECQNTTLCRDNSVCTAINIVDTCVCNSGFEFEESSVTTCIDIKECTLNPDRCSQLCVETEGGYTCVCDQTGYKLDADSATCIICDDRTYGNNCTESCTCDESNTVQCNHTSGTCLCESEWEGDNCQTDINECEPEPNGCPANSTCNNKNGTYDCDCNAGFIKTAENLCQSCSGNTYGDKCLQDCTCTMLNTESCDPVSGQCSCKLGWNGTNCTDDVNECENATICGDSLKTCGNTNGSFVCSCNASYILSSTGSCEDVDECAIGQDICDYQCVNNEGSFACTCFDGQSGSLNNCTACTDSTYGTSCSGTCDCVTNHTLDTSQTCDHVNGRCQCSDAWTGDQCQDDVNECLDNSTCNITNGGCHNFDGGFVCSCFVGYDNTSTECEPVTENNTTLPIETDETSQVLYIVLGFNISEPDDLNVSATYQYYVDETTTALFKFFQVIVGEHLSLIIIQKLEIGTIKVNFTVVYKDTEEAGSLLTEGVFKLANNAPIVIFNTTTYAEALTIGNTAVDLDKLPSKCDVFNQVHVCQAGYECNAEKGVAECQLVSTSDNFGLIIGLSVGISMFLLLVFLVTAVAICIRRSKNKSKPISRRVLDDSQGDSPSRERRIFSQGIATRFNSFGRQRPIYGSADWEVDSTPSDDLHRTYKQWDTREPRSDLHLATEPENPQSNFSWDFLYNYLGPNEKYEIKRPKLDTGANPMYNDQ